tara:strand:- start:110 stop:1228 length:1119 start_codon:yes stop_codon:yes gene_type:complete
MIKYINKQNLFFYFQLIKNINWIILAVLTVLVFIGALILYSVSGGNFSPLAKNHLIKYGFCLIIFLMIYLSNTEFIFRNSYIFYFISIFTLIILFFVGAESGGSQRWLRLGFFNIQPSEISKVALTLALARYYSDFYHVNNNSFLKLIIPLILITVPFILIINQPDLGTGILLLSNGLFIILMSGLGLRLVILGLLSLSLLTPLVWNYLYDYQKQRILTFLSPENDPLGSGYHIAQSKIAIGSGGFWGKGYMKGSQSQLEFIPEIHTDFIFSVFSEEFGYFGSVIIIFLYIFLIFFCLFSSFRTHNSFAKLAIFGLSMNFFLYCIINISMVIGLVPVVGVPLPLLSFGGSAMLTIMISFGLIMNFNKENKLN